MEPPGPAGRGSAGPPDPGGEIILYDGVCGLCNGLVRFVLVRDRRDRFRFASLQSGFARDLLARHGRDPRDLDTLYVVAGGRGAERRLLSKSGAVLHILRRLGGLWALAVVAGACPRALRDAAYDLVARHRYRLFGKYATCPVPEAKWRSKFIDL